MTFLNVMESILYNDYTKIKFDRKLRYVKMFQANIIPFNKSV